MVLDQWIQQRLFPTPFALSYLVIALVAFRAGTAYGFLVTVAVLGMSVPQSYEMLGGIDFLLPMALQLFSSVILVLLIQLARNARSSMHASQESLERRGILLQTILDHVPGIIYVKDAEGRHLLGNRALTRVARKPWEEMQGRRDDEIWNTEDAGRWQENDRKVMSDYHTREFEEVLNTPEGLEYWLNCKTALPDSEFGGPVLIGVGTNITERILAQQRLAEQAQRKDQFLSALSHELRSPLMAMLGWAALVKKEKVTPEQALEVVERNAQLLRKMVEDLIEVNRANRGQLELEKERLDFRALVGGVFQRNRALAESKTIAMVWNEEELAPVWIEGDKERLDQVVDNLIANAINYTPESGHVTIELKTERHTLQLTIQDDGCGIPEEHLESIFDLYKPKTFQRESLGLGLHLALGRLIVEAHEGTLKVESEGEERGTRMLLQLPLDG